MATVASLQSTFLAAQRSGARARQTVASAVCSSRAAAPASRAAKLSSRASEAVGASSGFRSAGVAAVPRRFERKVARAVASSAAASSSSNPLAAFFAKNPKLETALYFGIWYFLNVKFNILNKQIYNFFPFPWFVSVIHLVIGLGIMAVFWATKLVPYQQPDKEFIKDVTLPSFLHAFGHCLTNVSFAAVAVSFTHTVKTLEPVFSAVGSYLSTGTLYPIPVYLALLPIMFGVALASATELSFTWIGFTTAMASNAAFAGRAIFSKNLMKRMSPVNLYNWVTIIALLFCIPPMIYFEGASLGAGIQAAISKVGAEKFYTMLVMVGAYYHLYNQVAYQALEKVEPITHAVGNVGKRIFVIGFSIIAFGNLPTTQTMIGSAIAIAGAGLYSYLKATMTKSKGH